MLLRNSPHKDSKKDSPLKSQGIIKDSPTERCCFSDAHVDKIRHCFPANVVFKSFDPTALSDFVSDVWVAFPATPFAIGYSYPFPDFTQFYPVFLFLNRHLLHPSYADDLEGSLYLREDHRAGRD
uniref:Uncharacterized protein n=1 Tax=Helianthus annuus TaxID=4232 RepID=A0A251TUS0_HELAN